MAAQRWFRQGMVVIVQAGSLLQLGVGAAGPTVAAAAVMATDMAAAMVVWVLVAVAATEADSTTNPNLQWQ